jgi:hypothetical protein
MEHVDVVVHTARPLRVGIVRPLLVDSIHDALMLAVDHGGPVRMSFYRILDDGLAF